jgi:EamA domain-containing membrane protein RarD
MVGLTVETLLLSVPALAYLVYLDHMGAGAFLRADTVRRASCWRARPW